MKSYKFYKKQTNSLFLISLFLTSVFLFSCGKNENNNVAKSGEVSIMVSGIDEQVVLTSDIANSQNQKASTQQNTVAGESVAKEQDFEDFSWSLSPDAPFLYDEGQITTVASTTNMVDIQFEHKVSKIEELLFELTKVKHVQEASWFYLGNSMEN